MGRPKKVITKSKGIRVRMTEEDFALLDIVARECGCTKTGVLMDGFREILRHFSIDDLILISAKLDEWRDKKCRYG